MYVDVAVLICSSNQGLMCSEVHWLNLGSTNGRNYTSVATEKLQPTHPISHN